MAHLHNSTYADDYLASVRNGTLKQGLGIGCRLDSYLRFKFGTFNLIMGQANVGKTDWIMWYMVALTHKHKINWLIFSSENSVGSLKRKILQFWTGKDLDKLSEDEYNRANFKMNQYFKFIDTDQLYTAQDLLDIFDQNKDQYDAAIIDPYNSLVIPTTVNQHTYDYEIASKIRLFCKRNNKTVYILAHAVTESLRKTHSKDHPYAGLPQPPNEADIEGGGKWANRADDFIVIHRYKAHESQWMITHVHVKKVKETETGGKPTFLDEPVHCYKYFNTFTINQVDPIASVEVVAKPLPVNKNFYDTEPDFNNEPPIELPF
jgi:hypothetical protein